LNLNGISLACSSHFHPFFFFFFSFVERQPNYRRRSSCDCGSTQIKLKTQ
jgi:hypothetical protein